MLRGCQKRARKRRNSSNLGKAKKKSKSEVCIDSINNESDSQSLGKEIYRDIVFEDNSLYLRSCTIYDINLDEQEPQLPEGYFEDEHIAEVQIKTSHFKADYTAQGTPVVLPKLLDKENILNKFYKVEHILDPKGNLIVITIIGINGLKPADIRSNLDKGFRRIALKIIEGKLELLDRSFKCIIKNERQKKLYEKLKTIILSHQSFFASFNPLGNSAKIPKKKPKSGKKKKYNGYINKSQLQIYILDPVLRKAFRYYVKILLAGVTSGNLSERLGIFAKDPDNFDVEELGNFLMNMCMRVIYVNNNIKTIEKAAGCAEVLIKSSQDGKNAGCKKCNKEEKSKKIETQNDFANSEAHMKNRINDKEAIKNYHLDKSTQGFTLEVSELDSDSSSLPDSYLNFDV